MTSTILGNGKLVEGLSFDDYLSNPAYGSSDLRTFRQGPPSLVPWNRAHRSDGTSATRVGSAAHCAILQPETFARIYAHKPQGMTFASKDGKAWRDAHAGIEILTFAESSVVDSIVAGFHAKEACREALANAVACEASVFWVDEYGLPRKSRPDFFTKTAVHELKISVHAEKGLAALRRRAYSEGWIDQLASNRDGLRAAGHNVSCGRITVIAPTEPCGIRIWNLHLTENTLDLVALDQEITSREMVVCHRSGVWPGTPEDWITVELPEDNSLADLELDEVEEAPAESDKQEDDTP